MDFFGLIAINDWLLLIIGLIIVLHFYTSRKFDYWTKQGVPGPKPKSCYLNYYSLFKEGLFWDTKLVKKYGKTVGSFEGNQPYLITTDDDILREVFVKQFNVFANRRVQKLKKELRLDKSLVMITQEEGWKRIRDLMSPTFSSGKLRMVSDRINECSEIFVEKYKKKDGEIIDLKASFGEVAMSLIATVAFGIDMKNTEIYEEFEAMGTRLLGNQTGWRLFLQFMNFVFPKPTTAITKALNITIIDTGPFQYFGKIIDQVLDSRTKGEKPLDFIQLMANAHNDNDTDATKNEGMTREEIVANGITFFLGGFDTVSSGLSILFYHLAINPEAQEKAYEEVSELINNKKRISYEDMAKLKYLEWCLYEAMRLIPAPKLERRVTEDVTIKGIFLEKDMLVSIPVYQIHHDEERWENPEIFRPERFSEEEKKDRSPFSWLSFGYGPRNCIGMRLAIMEVKIVAAHMLYNFRVEQCSKTEVPYKLHHFGIINHGMEVKLIRRSSS